MFIFNISNNHSLQMSLNCNLAITPITKTTATATVKVPLLIKTDTKKCQYLPDKNNGMTPCRL
ncbi:MAG: hypothetical protein JWP45_3209 [Mucilaginibacter sp.]|nr:hypothetical protein [Mucilaginibacter sp.]